MYLFMESDVNKRRNFNKTPVNMLIISAKKVILQAQVRF